MTEIYVNKTPFFGRTNEQRQFRATLDRALRPSKDEPDPNAPFIVLLYGDGGMGKSTLLRRFWDILNAEYRDKFTPFWLDWESERRYSPDLHARANVNAELFFNTLAAALIRADATREKVFAEYRRLLDQREIVYKEARDILNNTDKQDILAPLHGATAIFIAKFLRVTLEGAGLPMDDNAENATLVLAEMGLKKSAEESHQIALRLKQRLESRMEPAALTLLLHPHQRMAQAFGIGLATLALQRPFILFMDTYEIADRADHWLRLAMVAAGPRVLWAIAGRADLIRSGKFGDGWLIGYGQEFPHRLQHHNMEQLAVEDIRNYFAAVVPQRPLSDDELHPIFRATRAIPLAVAVAADLWKEGQPLSEIVRDIPQGAPGAMIVKTMTERYHLHCIHKPEDRYALYALALGDKDEPLLRAMLQPANQPDWQLAPLLNRLERDYASVHREPARLHEEAVTFFRDHLREPVRRHEPRTRQLIQNAIRHLWERLQRVEKTLPLIESRCEDETWRGVVVQFLDFLFWESEEKAWRWFAPRFVEGWAYSRELRRVLLATVRSWKPWLTSQSIKRLERLTEDTTFSFISVEALRELDGFDQAGWLKGGGEAERTAIMRYLHGQVAYNQNQYEEALRWYEGITLLPEGGTELKRLLIEALYYVSSKLLYTGIGGVSKPSHSALRATTLGVRLDDTHTGVLYNHAEASRNLNHASDALSSIQKCIALQGESANPYDFNILGNVYHTLHRFEEAIDAYLNAIRLDSEFARAYYNLGNTYLSIRRFEEAIDAYLNATRLNPQFVSAHENLGITYRTLCYFDNAIESYKNTIHLAPKQATAHGSLARIYRDIGDTKAYNHHIMIVQNLMVETPSYEQACIEAVIGNHDIALEKLAIAISESLSWQNFARVDPDFDDLRDDPRFRALVGLDE